MNSVFITGTGTHIGKTHVVCKLAAATQKTNQTVMILKPVATGCKKEKGEWIIDDLNRYQHHVPKASIYTGYCFELPVSPHLAAHMAKVCLSAYDIASWCQQYIIADHVTLIEGAGGLLVPLNMKETWVDVIQYLNIPVILVVGIQLGCINHALLTARTLQAECLSVVGWIANHLDNHCLYPELIETFLIQTLSFPFLGRLPYEPHESVKVSQGASCIT